MTETTEELEKTAETQPEAVEKKTIVTIAPKEKKEKKPEDVMKEFNEKAKKIMNDTLDELKKLN